jgi:hypothetical protein
MRQKSQYSLRGLISRALDHARMERASFSENLLKPEFPLPKTEAEVTAFIKGRTKLWRESWLIPPLEQALSKIKMRDGKNAKSNKLPGA